MTSSAFATRTFEGIAVPESGTYQIDSAHTVVGFVARYLMVTKVRGSFSEFSGAITVADNPLESSVTATISSASINTGNEMRDGHVRGGDFLDVETYPELTFVSKRIASHAGTEFVLVGDLTIRGTTREVELAVEFDGVSTNLYGKPVLAFTAKTEIDRHDFGVSWNAAIETGGVAVGPKVKIEIEGQAVRDDA
jgi:polyisoprenoid-binding protein YceI